MKLPQRPTDDGAPVRLRFADFELDRRERRLLRAGVELPLRARAFDMLVALAGRAGQLVTKDELLEQVWRGVVVEENNIAAQIVALRRALGGELIATVPGRAATASWCRCRRPRATQRCRRRRRLPRLPPPRRREPAGPAPRRVCSAATTTWIACAGGCWRPAA